MCLASNQCMAKVAKKDIECYKVVELYTEANEEQLTRPTMPEEFFSKFHCFKYVLGKTYICDNFEKEVQRKIIEYGFHSYANLTDAYSSCDCAMPRITTDLYGRQAMKEEVLLKCIIPKGALYFDGTADTLNQYCSDKIKVVAWKRHWNVKWYHGKSDEDLVSIIEDNAKLYRNTGKSTFKMFFRSIGLFCKLFVKNFKEAWCESRQCR